MNKTAVFEKKILDLMKGRYKNMLGHHALAGGGLGSAVGGLVGLGDTAYKQMKGDYEDLSAGDVASLYLNKGMSGALKGGLGGGVLGTMRGKANLRNLMKGHEADLRSALGSASGAARENLAAKIFKDTTLKGGFSEINPASHLSGSESVLDKLLGKTLNILGKGPQATDPQFLKKQRDKISKGFRNLAASKSREHRDIAIKNLQEAGLASHEIEALLMSLGGQQAGGDFKSRLKGRKLVQKDLEELLRSKGINPKKDVVKYKKTSKPEPIPQVPPTEPQPSAQAEPTSTPVPPKQDFNSLLNEEVNNLNAHQEAMRQDMTDRGAIHGMRQSINRINKIKRARDIQNIVLRDPHNRANQRLLDELDRLLNDLSV